MEYGHLSYGYVKTFYYDCLPHRKQGEDDISFANRRKDNVLEPKRKKYQRLSTRNEAFVVKLAKERYGKKNGMIQLLLMLEENSINVSPYTTTHNYQEYNCDEVND